MLGGDSSVSPLAAFRNMTATPVSTPAAASSTRSPATEPDRSSSAVSWRRGPMLVSPNPPSTAFVSLPPPSDRPLPPSLSWTSLPSSSLSVDSSSGGASIFSFPPSSAPFYPSLPVRPRPLSAFRLPPSPVAVKTEPPPSPSSSDDERDHSDGGGGGSAFDPAVVVRRESSARDAFDRQPLALRRPEFRAPSGTNVRDQGAATRSAPSYHGPVRRADPDADDSDRAGGGRDHDSDSDYRDGSGSSGSSVSGSDSDDDDKSESENNGDSADDSDSDYVDKRSLSNKTKRGRRDRSKPSAVAATLRNKRSRTVTADDGDENREPIATLKTGDGDGGGGGRKKKTFAVDMKKRRTVHECDPVACIAIRVLTYYLGSPTVAEYTEAARASFRGAVDDTAGDGKEEEVAVGVGVGVGTGEGGERGRGGRGGGGGGRSGAVGIVGWRKKRAPVVRGERTSEPMWRVVEVLYCRDVRTGALWIKADTLNRAMASDRPNAYSRLVQPLLRTAPTLVQKMRMRKSNGALSCYSGQAAWFVRASRSTLGQIIAVRRNCDSSRHAAIRELRRRLGLGDDTSFEEPTTTAGGGAGGNSDAVAPEPVARTGSVTQMTAAPGAKRRVTKRAVRGRKTPAPKRPTHDSITAAKLVRDGSDDLEVAPDATFVDIARESPDRHAGDGDER